MRKENRDFYDSMLIESVAKSLAETLSETIGETLGETPGQTLAETIRAKESRIGSYA